MTNYQKTNIIKDLINELMRFYSVPEIIEMVNCIIRVYENKEYYSAFVGLNHYLGLCHNFNILVKSMDIYEVMFVISEKYKYTRGYWFRDQDHYLSRINFLKDMLNQLSDIE